MADPEFTYPEFYQRGEPFEGRCTLVGERGPELFIPAVSGEVIPKEDATDES